MVSVIDLNLCVNLDKVLIALSVSVNVRTRPSVLVSVPAPMVTVCVASARIFPASLVVELTNDIVSVSVLVLAESLATVELMVMASVSARTIF